MRLDASASRALNVTKERGDAADTFSLYKCARILSPDTRTRPPGQHCHLTLGRTHGLVSQPAEHTPIPSRLQAAEPRQDADGQAPPPAVAPPAPPRPGRHRPPARRGGVPRAGLRAEGPHPHHPPPRGAGRGAAGAEARAAQGDPAGPLPPLPGEHGAAARRGGAEAPRRGARRGAPRGVRRATTSRGPSARPPAPLRPGLIASLSPTPADPTTPLLHHPRTRSGPFGAPPLPHPPGEVRAAHRDGRRPRQDPGRVPHQRRVRRAARGARRRARPPRGRDPGALLRCVVVPGEAGVGACGSRVAGCGGEPASAILWTHEASRLAPSPPHPPRIRRRPSPRLRATSGWRGTRC